MVSGSEGEEISLEPLFSLSGILTKWFITFLQMAMSMYGTGKRVHCLRCLQAMGKAASTDAPTAEDIPAFVPETSNALTTAHYLTRVLGEIQEGINELLSMEVSGEASSGLESLLESARWRFLDALTSVWLRGW